MPETKFTEVVRARLPAGSIDLIDEVLKGGELRSGFIRAAVAAELERRLGASKGDTVSNKGKV